MKRIAIEEHFWTEGFIKHLRTRKEWPKWDVVEDEEHKKMDRVSWAPSHYMVIPPQFTKKFVDITEERLKDMDENGIDMQVLSLSFPGIEALDASAGPMVAKGTNDDLAKVVEEYPDRFAGFAALAPQDPSAAAHELERAVKDLGFKGALINSHVRGEYLDDPKYWVIFAKAEELGVPIYLHPRQPSSDMLKPYLDYPWLASAVWGFAAEAGLHAMRLISCGLFDKYPDLKIILGHLGEALPLWLWRMDNKWLMGEGKITTKRIAKEKPGYYIKNNFYVTTSGMFWDPALSFVSSVLGPDKVLFAVDYPFESNEDAVQFMDSASLSEGDREKIYHLNAEKLLTL